MLKVKLGFVTVSAAASFAVTGNGAESISATVVFHPSDATTLNAGTEKLEVSRSTINSTTQWAVFPSAIQRWTKIQQRRYKQLVVKFACSDLSEADGRGHRRCLRPSDCLHHSSSERHHVERYERIYRDISHSFGGCIAAPTLVRNGSGNS